MKPKLDASNHELARVLDALLSANTDITVREVSRNHASLRNASAFTRDPLRMEMISEAQMRQKQLRASLTQPNMAAKSLSDKLTQMKEANDVLGKQVNALLASHAACIQAVMTIGGLSALERYWRDYKAIGEAVRPALATIPKAQVIGLKGGKPRALAEKED